MSVRADVDRGLDIVATTDDIANANGMLISPHTYFERIAPQFRQAILAVKPDAQLPF